MSHIEVLDRLNGEQLAQLHGLFQNEWWTQQRELMDMPRLVEESDLIVALWDAESQKLVGFSRVLTDFLYRAFICDVIVDNTVRGLGLGKRLMQEILDRLQEVERVELYCQQDKTPFYEKLGFSELETTRFLRWQSPVQNQPVLTMDYSEEDG